MPLLRASHQSYPLFRRFQERQWVLNGACPKHLMECLMNSHHDSTRGEIRLSLHFMPFCRTCEITESWAAPAWLNYNNASDVKPRNVPRAVELRKSVTRSASKQPVEITHVPQYAPLTVRSYTVRRCTVSTQVEHLQAYIDLLPKRAQGLLTPPTSSHRPTLAALDAFTRHGGQKLREWALTSSFSSQTRCCCSPIF